MNTSVAHNLHHKRFNGNYGLYTLFWDRLMGTLRNDYDATFEEVTEPKVKAKYKANIKARTMIEI